MKRAAAYCRVSTASSEQLASLAEQESFFTDYAKEHGLILHRIYADGGVSGTRLKDRRAFGEMMEGARAGAFELLLVKDISRMARNVLDFLQSVRELKHLGIDCRFLTANCSSGEGELFLTILAAVAQEESANLSRRVKFTKDHHARLGRVPNLVYGYERKEGDLFHLTINEREASVVRRIYQLALDGWGSRRIARLLKAEGVLTKKGRLFGESSVRQVLKSSLYCGVLRTHQTEVRDYLTGERRRVPPEEQYTFCRDEWAIVEKDVWQAVQEKRACARTEKTAAVQGLIVCAVCGRPFRRRRQKHDDVWLCGKRSREGASACTNQTRITEDDLEDALGHWLDEWLSPAKWAEVMRRAERMADASTTEARRVWEERRSRQDALLASGAITAGEYARRCELLADEARKSGAVWAGARSAEREDVLAYMVKAAVRSRWIRRIRADEDGEVTVLLR